MKKLILLSIILIIGCEEEITITAPESKDCAGVSGGNAIEDSCGNCEGVNTTGCADVEGNEVDCGEQEGEYCNCNGDLRDCMGFCGVNTTDDMCADYSNIFGEWLSIELNDIGSPDTTWQPPNSTYKESWNFNDELLLTIINTDNNDTLSTTNWHLEKNKILQLSLFFYIDALSFNYSFLNNGNMMLIDENNEWERILEKQ